MSDNENNQDNAGDRNDHFLSNRRAIESSENIHDKFGGRRGMPQIINGIRSVKAAAVGKPFRF
jgi:hypothetical protein